MSKISGDMLNRYEEVWKLSGNMAKDSDNFSNGSLKLPETFDITAKNFSQLAERFSASKTSCNV